MKWMTEFRDKVLCDKLLQQIIAEVKRPVRLMEVCGGHTLAIRRFGINTLLPPEIHLISGPGCPVCVTGKGYIDQAIQLAKIPGVTVCTFGDLIRVPGSGGTLEQAKSSGASVNIVYSPLQALEMATKTPDREIVMLGIGFETTAPSTATVVQIASQNQINNFYLLSAHKVMPPAMEAIIHEGIAIDGYLCPGHVSTITGIAMYKPLAADYGVGCVVSGFEPADILQSILMLLRQINLSKPAVEIQYTRAVRPEGNPKAMALIHKIFRPADAYWRGLGILRNSGLALSRQFEHVCAAKEFGLPDDEPDDHSGCLCGDILKGFITPEDCPLFARTCTPEHPVGACMVSSEGACQTYFQYGKRS